LGDAEVLIMHDPDDRDTPFARSAELAAIRPATTIAAIEGGGHSRILSEPAVLDRLVAFATGSEVSEESAA
jgi:pimeloyl-ACP methyl ester carboxylesterase